MSSPPTLTSVEQYPSVIDNDSSPEPIPLPSTSPSSSSSGSAIAQATTAQTTPTTEISGDPPTILVKEYVALQSSGEASDEHSVIHTEPTDYPTCSECNICTSSV